PTPALPRKRGRGLMRCGGRRRVRLSCSSPACGGRLGGGRLQVAVLAWYAPPPALPPKRGGGPRRGGGGRRGGVSRSPPPARGGGGGGAGGGEGGGASALPPPRWRGEAGGGAASGGGAGLVCPHPGPPPQAGEGRGPGETLRPRGLFPSGEDRIWRASPASPATPFPRKSPCGWTSSRRVSSRRWPTRSRWPWAATTT